MKKTNRNSGKDSKKVILIILSFVAFLLAALANYLFLRSAIQENIAPLSTLLIIGSLIYVLLGALLALSIRKLTILPDPKPKKMTGNVYSTMKRTLSPGKADALDLAELDSMFRTGLEQFDAKFESQKQFVANAIHELNTPAALLRLSIDSYRKRMEDAKIFDYVFMDTIDHATKRIEKLVGQIEKLDAKAEQEAYGLINVPEMIQHVNDLASKIASHKQITIEETFEGREELFSNQVFIQSILLNLLENAIKYSPAETTITVSAVCQENGCDFVVEDQGIGIPAKDLPHVLERFYRASQSRARKTGGSGLGLAITDEMVRKLGGRLNIESEVGKGTRVTVFIPNLTNEATDVN